ncbi:MAG: hypothetical protein ACKOYQ_05420 [Actinomycetota bacterium]
MSTDPQDEAPADDLTDSELDEVTGGAGGNGGAGDPVIGGGGRGTF